METTKQGVFIHGVEYVPKDSVTELKQPEKNSYDEALSVYKAFCEEKELDSSLPYPNPANDDEENTNAFVMIKTIVKTENGDKMADALDIKQYKYYPWFKVSGFGLSYGGYDRWAALSSVPARLCSLTSDKAEELGKKYIAIYNILQK